MDSMIAKPIFQTQFGIPGEMGAVMGDQHHSQCDGMRGNQPVARIPLRSRVARRTGP